jgi:2-C-methyl-D-erythritol 4-phosphate cytidylyltransferase
MSLAEDGTRTTAVVLAGGTGRRLGLEAPKQLATVGGRSILDRSIGAFDAAPEIDEILVVMAPGHHAAAEEAARPYSKVIGIIDGGVNRTDSTLRALAALADRPDEARVLFHDAARPFVEMPPRSSLRRFQTPQGFRLGTIRAAYDLALADPGFAATDDCGVVHRYLPDVPIVVVTGSEQNIKITHPMDLLIAEQITARENDPGSAD